VLADQGIHAGIVDVVGDQHDRAGADRRLQRARRVGEDQGFDACLLQLVEDRAHDGGIAAFIRVRPARQHGHLLSTHLANIELARVAGNLRHGKAGKLRVRNDQRVLDDADDIAQGGAEDDGGFRRAGAQFGLQCHFRFSGPKEAGSSSSRVKVRIRSPCSSAAVDFHIACRKLANFLAAAAAGRAERVAIAHHNHFSDACATRHDEVRDGGGFSAPALRISGVFDVAARMDTALFIAHGGADEEPGVGRVGFGACGFLPLPQDHAWKAISSTGLSTPRSVIPAKAGTGLCRR
jgi:hypothetical protein